MPRLLSVLRSWLARPPKVVGLQAARPLVVWPLVVGSLAVLSASVAGCTPEPPYRDPASPTRTGVDAGDRMYLTIPDSYFQEDGEDSGGAAPGDSGATTQDGGGTGPQDACVPTILNPCE